MHPIVLNESFRAVFYAPFYVAVDQGHFARQGLDLRMVHVGNPDRAAEGPLNGTADVAWGGPMRPMQRISRDPSYPLRCFGAVVMRDPFVMVGRGQNSSFRLGDLSRLRLGVVSEAPTPWWCLQDDLRSIGLNPAGLDVVLDRTMAQNSAALLAGDIDVAMVFEPFAAELEERECSVWYAAANRGPTAYTAYYATPTRIVERREEFQAMMRGLAEALRWVHDATPLDIADAISERFPEVPIDRLARALSRYQSLGIWAESPRFPAVALERLAQAMISSGVMAHYPGYDRCVDADLSSTA